MELKPCPFCGEKAVKSSWFSPSNDTLYQVSCENDHCQLQPSTAWKRSDDDVVRAWNRRTDNGTQTD